MASLSFTTFDVFTKTPYEGNPLAIVIIPSYLQHTVTQEKKQTIAREFNLSETLFLHEKTSEKLEWVVDTFTTTDELPFAGHPTIGAACYVLNLQSSFGSRSGIFITKAGPIPISLSGAGVGGVQADIPHNVHIHKHTIGDLQVPVPGLSQHPVLEEAEMNAPIVSIVKGMTFLLVKLESLEVLRMVESTSRELNFHGLLDGGGWEVGFVARYYYVVENTQRSGEEVISIRTRLLELTMEDPATGSAACALGSYLALKEGRTSTFEITQGVEMGRWSFIGVEVEVNKQGRTVENVRLNGSAVQVMEGTLRI